MDTTKNEIDPPTTSPATNERADELLQAASVLLERGSFLHAVHALHAETDRTLGRADGSAPEEPYVSREQAEERHRRMLAELGKEEGSLAKRPLRQLLRQAPTWVAWAIVAVLVLGFVFKSGSSLLRKSRWKNEYADGNWISRYYGNARFEGAALMRYDTSANHDFRSRAPGPGMSKDRWSARWDTCLVVTKGADLALHLASDDGSKLLVDEVIQAEIGPRPGKKSFSLSLREGVRHLSVELVDRGGKSFVRLEGLNFEGTDAYTFRRPLLDADDVRCE